MYSFLLTPRTLCTSQWPKNGVIFFQRKKWCDIGVSNFNTSRFYELNASPETVVEVVLNLRRKRPYFYDTLWVIKFTLVSALILCPKQPWWSASLAHTIAWCMTMPQLSAQMSFSHHGNATCAWFARNPSGSGGQVARATTTPVYLYYF